MTETELILLRRLDIDLGAAYLEMVDEFLAAGEAYPYNNIPLAREDMAAYVRELEEEAAGMDLPPGIVPQTTYVLVRNGCTVLGEIRFRPATQPPFRVGHDHIGYNVRPAERRRGYARMMLAMVLDEARALGLDGVSLTVEGENPGSTRLLETFGGRVLEERIDQQSGERIRVYWIPIGNPQSA